MKGSSTVDLFITSDALLSDIIQLKVSTPRFRSCHCMVNMTMKVDQLVIEEPTLMNFLQILFGTIFTKDILSSNYKTKILSYS